ncbi:uncharacterized protein LOC122178245 isoform X2 [Lagopus leucura]|uniref:uncharacterized protein LOC122178245 isoform X2 n=1 Tax=Lagopus leucura TaxID=30410 RepID=UPI001C66D390|nr:uncharacterized protein LOC122178245 isoform X2 [Lagopus leucura]
MRSAQRRQRTAPPDESYLHGPPLLPMLLVAQPRNSSRKKKEGSCPVEPGKGSVARQQGEITPGAPAPALAPHPPVVGTDQQKPGILSGSSHRCSSKCWRTVASISNLLNNSNKKARILPSLFTTTLSLPNISLRRELCTFCSSAEIKASKQTRPLPHFPPASLHPLLASCKYLNHCEPHPASCG